MRDLSILMMTMNRAEFVNRALHFYCASGFDGQIIIGDSSVSPHHEAMLDIVAHFSGRLNIVYDHMPRKDYPRMSLVLDRTIELLDTPYVVLAPDDDLQSTGAMRAALKLLRADDAYAAAMGQRINVRLGRMIPSAPLREAALSAYPDFDLPQAADRAELYAHSGGATLYAVMRSSVLRAVYSHATDKTLAYWAEEFLPCCRVVIAGRLKSLPLIGPIAQMDGSGGIWRRNSPFALITDPEWPEFYRAMRDILADDLMAADGLPREDAERRAEAAVWRHLNKLMPFHFQRIHEGADYPAWTNALPALMGKATFAAIADFLAQAHPLPLAGWVNGGAADWSAEAVRAKAEAAEAEADPVAAGLWFRYLLQAAPDDAPARVGLARTLHAQERHEEALAELTALPGHIRAAEAELVSDVRIAAQMAALPQP